jgi:hypothetical protein
MVNFAAQPEQGGGMNVYTADDLVYNIQPNTSGFGKIDTWAKGCYPKNDTIAMTTQMKNSTGSDILDTLNSGLDFFTQQSKSAADKAQAQAATQIAQLNLLTAQQQTASASTAASKVKAYAVPIAITGVVVIGAIAAYFIFKKKKIN